MSKMTRSRRYACVQPHMQIRGVAALLLAVFMLTTLGWTREACGQSKLPRVGIILVDATSDAPAAGDRSEVILQALADQGWIEGQNVSFEVRNVRGEPPRFTEAAAELVRLQVDVIWADSAPALRAAYAATRTIPIVTGDYTTDPVAAGYAESYARPGGNVTGVFLDAPEFSGKWLELLKAIVPDLSQVAVLWDPSPGDAHLRALKAISPSLGVQLQVIEVSKPEGIDGAGTELRGRPQALIVLPSPMTYSENTRIARLALKERLPATSIFLTFAEAGGTVAYGPEPLSVAERVAVLATRVLNGTKPAHLPIERPTKFQLVLNLKTARDLGITIPQSILLRADEVIE
ncbi:MAG: ABC transporter substrate-binding protein [Betaproteobacteria bacterium]|nr:MAG: ABC transporter substrate-binding protein [Betaproteobacteria bacterium]